MTLPRVDTTERLSAADHILSRSLYSETSAAFTDTTKSLDSLLHLVQSIKVQRCFVPKIKVYHSTRNSTSLSNKLQWLAALPC